MNRTTIAVTAVFVLVGQTQQSTLKISSCNGFKAVLKLCRTPNIPRAADNWRNEVNMLKLVSGHKNVAFLLDSDAKQLSIMLRYEPGQSLENFVKSSDTGRMSTLSEDECDQVWEQISDALDHLHSKDIIHRDVKPQNIIWSREQKKASLIDFGIACQAIPGTFRTAGTPCYVAPEYLQRMMSDKSDMWGFVIVIAFAYGYLPLPDKIWVLAEVWQDAAERRKMLLWIKHIMQLRKHLLESRPLVARMLELDPEKRVTSHDLARSLRQRQELLVR